MLEKTLCDDDTLTFVFWGQNMLNSILFIEGILCFFFNLRNLQGTGMEGPIPSTISKLTNLTEF